MDSLSGSDFSVSGIAGTGLLRSTELCCFTNNWRAGTSFQAMMNIYIYIFKEI